QRRRARAGIPFVLPGGARAAPLTRRRTRMHAKPITRRAVLRAGAAALPLAMLGLAAERAAWAARATDGAPLDADRLGPRARRAAPAAQRANPFLAGNFAPVHEEIAADNLTVVGELPAGLSGMFVRNGPNPQFEPIGRYHWFDGDGMLNGVRIQDGKASYLNRYVRTAGWQQEHEAGRALWSGLLEPPRLGDPAGPFKNAANTSVVWHDGRLLALWEGGDPYAIELPGLETSGPYTYCGSLSHNFTAHPKVDAATGEMLFFGYRVARQPYVQYSVASKDGA